MEQSTSSFPSIPPPPQKNKRLSVLLIVAILLVGFVSGGLIGYFVTYSNFNTKLTNLQSQIGCYQSSSSNGIRLLPF